MAICPIEGSVLEKVDNHPDVVGELLYRCPTHGGYYIGHGFGLIPVPRAVFSNPSTADTRITNAYLNSSNQLVVVDDADAEHVIASGGDFLELSDTPSSYVGGGLQFVRVNAAEDALEFATPAGGGDVSGPGASTDNAIVRWDGTSGTLLQDYTSDAPIIAGNGVVDIKNTLLVRGNLNMYDGGINAVILSADAPTTFRNVTFGDFAGEVVIGSAAQTLTTKTIDADSNTISNLEHGAEVDDPTAAHGATGAVVGTTNVQTLTNKTLASLIAATQIVLDQTTEDYTLIWADPAAARQLTIPDPLGDDIFAFLSAAQTLANKTLTTPIISATGFTNSQHAHAAANSGGQVAHTALITVGVDDHHARDHAATHGNGGADSIEGINLAITGNWDVSGITGRIKPQSGDGAPSHTEIEGTLYWDETNDAFYVNNNGSTGWTNVSAGSGAGAGEAFVTVGNTGGLSAERALTGTTNQVVITDNGVNSTVVLSTPQDLATASLVQFGQATLERAGAVLSAQNTTDAASNLLGTLGGGNRITPANNDEAYLALMLDNDGGTQTEFVRLTWKALDVADASKDSRPELQYYTANTFRELSFPPITADDVVAVLALAQTLTNKTIDADSNTITNIGSSEAAADLIDGQTVQATPGSGDQFLIYDAGLAALRKIDWDTLPGAGGGIANVSEDTTPQLGGDLDVNGQSIVSITAGNIPITPDTTGRVQISNLTVQAGNVVFNEATNDLTLAVADQATGARTLTIPDLGAADGDLVVSNLAQTLTNKTLTAPTISATGFTDAQHAHAAANSGGTLDAAAIAAGTLIHERGGLEADVSAFAGLVAIAAGATAQVDTKAELEAQLTDVSDLAEADGDVFTGVHDFGGADSLEIPNGAGGTTVDAAGEVAVDTTPTGGSLNFHDGTAERALRPLQSKSITIESPTSSEDIIFFHTEFAITVQIMRAVTRGTTPSVTWTIRHSTDRSAAGAEVVTGGTTTTSATTGDDVTTFNDATIPADSWVWIETTAQTGTVAEIGITVHYAVDP